MLAVVERGPRRAPTTGADRPSVSVLVPTYQGAARLGTCLGSLGVQTLDPTEFEVVVVLNGPRDGSRDVVADFCATHPRHRVRVVELREGGLGNARNVGLATARGAYVTYLDDDDRVTPSYLAAMLELAEPDVVVAALIGNLAEDADPTGVPDVDTYVGRGLGPMAGRTVPGHRLVTAFSYNNAKLLSTEIARLVRYDPELASGEDHVYWLALFAERSFRLRVVGDKEALYLRSVRAGSLGQQETSYDFNVTQRLRCMQAMEAVDRTDQAVASVAHGLMKGQGWWINSYLRQFPDDHERVVADVTELGLREFPWPSVNAGLGRDLAICYCFPPFQDTSAMVAAKRLQERGLVTDVISHDVSAFRSRDPGSVALAEPVVGRTHVVTGPASLSNWRAVPDFASQAWATMRGWEDVQGAYRTVYSRSVAMNSHFAAALIKLRRPEIDWVAEFSDPMRLGVTGDERPGEVLDDWLSDEIRRGMQHAGFDPARGVKLFDWVERVAFALADRIVFTNQHQMDFMLRHCPDPALVDRARSIATVSHHPVPPAPCYDLVETRVDPEPGVVQLAYFGVFYTTRDLGDVVRALTRLHQHERAHVLLHVFTNQPDSLSLEVVRAGLAGVVRVRPFVPVLEMLSLTKQFDVLVVNDAATADHHEVNPYLPSKLADYRGSGTPIWAISEPGSVMSSMDFDHTSSLGDVDAAVGVLRDLIAARTPA